MGLEELAGYYQRLIKDRVERAKRGERYRGITNSMIMGNEHAMLGLIQNEATRSNPQVVETREYLFKRILYNKLEELEGKGIDIEKIAAATQHPLITGAVLWMKAHSGSKRSRGKFVEEFHFLSVLPFRQTWRFIPPLAVLEGIINQPEVLPNVDPSSVYLTHYLFPNRRPTTMKEIEREISEVIPTLISPQMIGLTQEMMKHIEHHPKSISKGMWYLGKYAFPQPGRFRWRAGSREVDIDPLFENPETRKEVYETAMQCVDTTSSAMIRYDKQLSNLSQRSKFGLSRREYREIMLGVEMFALNQLLGSFKNSDGEAVHRSYLSYRTGLIPHIEGEHLVVESDRSAARYTLDSQFKSSSRRLPLAACIIDRMSYNAIENSE